MQGKVLFDFYDSGKMFSFFICVSFLIIRRCETNRVGGPSYSITHTNISCYALHVLTTGKCLLVQARQPLAGLLLQKPPVSKTGGCI
jgi:hypothetical protein